MADRHRLNHWTTLALRRLGLKAHDVQTKRMTLGPYKVSGSRVMIEGMPFIHLVGSSSRNRLVRTDEAKVIAALCDHLPAVAIVNQRAGDIDRVEVPGWAFAALLRMVERCPQDARAEILAGYLPSNQVQISPEEKAIGSQILSTLDSGGPS